MRNNVAEKLRGFLEYHQNNVCVRVGALSAGTPWIPRCVLACLVRQKWDQLKCSTAKSLIMAGVQRVRAHGVRQQTPTAIWTFTVNTAQVITKSGKFLQTPTLVSQFMCKMLGRTLTFTVTAAFYFSPLPPPPQPAGCLQWNCNWIAASGLMSIVNNRGCVLARVWRYDAYHDSGGPDSI